MRIDSHQHFWKYHPVKGAWITDDMLVIKKDFLPPDLQPLLLQNKIDGCIAVQADQSPAETEFLLHLAGENDFIKGVVGWVDLKANDLESKLLHYKKHSKLKGFRHIVQAEPQGFLLQDDFINGIKLLGSHNYTYDLLIHQHQLKEAIAFVNKLPNQKIVIDHCAKPTIKNKEIDNWAALLKEISFNKNISCKLSGLITEANWQNWKPDDIIPYMDVVFEVFSPHRILFGSDWPVMLLAGGYKQWLNMVEEYLNQFSATEKEMVMGINAMQFYG